MPMKKTDLEKNKALKLNNAMKLSTADRFGKPGADKLDRREQRKLDQAQGLVPFACKIDGELVATLKARAVDHPGGLSGLLNEVIQRGLGDES
ncbi:hypothetical protein [Paraburkholderia sp.]|uniref:hypothetical protein n=1 Tax=Paraburkholderia sp. TaxID=1926495 RepID=UPI00239FB409|nr:hypothetical protein [Paraburkholderia sp.]MDE1181158.1 hypothetical protein [Paraburkholderia sp.]